MAVSPCLWLGADAVGTPAATRTFWIRLPQDGRPHDVASVTKGLGFQLGSLISTFTATCPGGMHDGGPALCLPGWGPRPLKRGRDSNCLTAWPLGVQERTPVT